MIKVRGFQVAPAELEGCILDHSDVADTCVVSIQDEYSGELPFAYVVLHPEPAARARENPGDEEELRQSIMKASESMKYLTPYAVVDPINFSMWQTTRWHTRNLLEASNLSR
jgi:acyl-CoA synthetase (AMP-forming)/AMP-acid ligase II